MVDRFEEAGTTSNNLPTGRPRAQHLLENIKLVDESVLEDPETSVKRSAQQLGLSKSSLHRILRPDLHLFLYMLQLTQELMLRMEQQVNKIVGSGELQILCKPVQDFYIRVRSLYGEEQQLNSSLDRIFLNLKEVTQLQSTAYATDK